jgi:hypothetical protein
MGTAYALLIQEDVAQLHAAEKAARDKKLFADGACHWVLTGILL